MRSYNEELAHRESECPFFKIVKKRIAKYAYRPNDPQARHTVG